MVFLEILNFLLKKFLIFEKFQTNIKEAKALKNIKKKFEDDPIHISLQYN